jgi:hypothetical protein
MDDEAWGAHSLDGDRTITFKWDSNQTSQSELRLERN